MLFLNVAPLEKIKKLVYEVPAPDKTNNESIKWTKDLINIILKYCVKHQSLVKCMRSNKPYIYEIHLKAPNH